ncbi:bifunctional tRNA (5-methylaminomethyl-2-thiouridine)(34)-methyltransferase MnmD/FAD-dependent 5-carboxymethylaminomethyl-2-thiouridine(34) oxidoreductase MnmC [Parahaliea aestuarii]|uniref:tRNA 5-methylaminomethyl-2-thiouridine biosynthesis bifunctional protein MnmC n=1 Tax=Parahaliea aestuarii TaxID=1852021 RepID=A0A5C9A0V9_9GAMM|nr:bifunctional tRNA (5-methylaminomethyl-2-thiouridine)(34)-methyltransferase MnmD/FAD-dependent 5-carboxymethylaminomethyl-2-thiouridine(34) oxidoreductase MnmC [Parahaliea aestuarii]TXS93410.1 bifunctional tRNA (5-methylaminomethyl-2-thiouridine)(34)-methyltransferase MnmD/FAD-dependent 5-carboxymethylaminomethyl-2-thiouridine(34) oxidoreductase MnmC [Parahaliea aestuarii]
MQRDNQPWQAMPAPRLDWSESGVPGSSEFGDIYFSRDDGLAESRFVFLDGNHLPQRWRAHPQDSFAIGETGFGTGLNFLLTWQAWAACPAPKPRLHYLSVEQYPLRREDLERALTAWPTLAGLAAELLAHYPAPVPGCHRLLLAGGQVTLDLWWADAEEALADLASQRRRWIDAWYLDGFAPARNAGMWSDAVLGHIGALSRPGATLATFTAVGAVRRSLQAAGFDMRKGPGFGRKRERLLGNLAAADITPAPTPTPAPPPTDTPWDIPRAPQPAPRTALVLGAGLAGCATAAALARRGITVQLLEVGKLAGAASGNAQGVLYTRLSRHHSALSDFALASFSDASRLYRQLFDAGELNQGIDGDLCGCFHQHHKADELADMAARLAEIPELARVLDPTEANTLLGVEQSAPGYWFPGSGWLSPPALCRYWSRRDGVILQEHCGPLRLQREGQRWLAVNEGGETVAAADCAVIACGNDSLRHSGLDWLPLQPIRGQTTTLPPGPPFDTLRAAFCHAGYMAPAGAEGHCMGATFNLNEDSAALNPRDQRQNLQRLAAAIPAWGDALAALENSDLPGRAAFRCTTPDYLPLAGPVPDAPALLATYAALRQNARLTIASDGPYMPGLYLNTGHGSRGLSSAPLCAELIASQACHEPPPLPRYLSRALAPARFLIRDLGRNKR